MPDAAVTEGDVSARDIETLQELNRRYVRSAEMSDVGWYSENLAEDFMSSSVDGSLVDRPGFLTRVARPHPGSNLEAHDVHIRILGDVALIHAAFKYAKPDGQSGSGRYTDIWARRSGRWLCVSAHFNRF
jgi:ketosteroid isomerase-like protein